MITRVYHIPPSERKLIEQHYKGSAKTKLRQWAKINRTCLKAQAQEAKRKSWQAKKLAQNTIEHRRWWYCATAQEFIAMDAQQWTMQESPELMKLAQVPIYTCMYGTNTRDYSHLEKRAALGIPAPERSATNVSRTADNSRTAW